MQIQSQTPLSFGFTVKVPPNIGVNHLDFDVDRRDRFYGALSRGTGINADRIRGFSEWIRYRDPDSQDANRYLVFDGPNDRQYTKLMKLLWHSQIDHPNRSKTLTFDEKIQVSEKLLTKWEQTQQAYIDQYDATLIRDPQGHLKLIQREDEVPASGKTLGLG